MRFRYITYGSRGYWDLFLRTSSVEAKLKRKAGTGLSEHIAFSTYLGTGTGIRIEATLSDRGNNAIKFPKGWEKFYKK
jgi:hypothetical protein